MVRLSPAPGKSATPADGPQQFHLVLPDHRRALASHDVRPELPR